jgi:hypothetical protein
MEGSYEYSIERRNSQICDFFFDKLSYFGFSKTTLIYGINISFYIELFVSLSRFYVKLCTPIRCFILNVGIHKYGTFFWNLNYFWVLKNDSDLRN